MSQRIFISKASHDCQELADFCRMKGFELVSESLISFREIPFEDNLEYEVVFFASIRAAEYYLKHKSSQRFPIFACVGEETNRKLNQLSIKCDFVGDKSGAPEKVAAQFKAWLGSRNVLFPHSDKSLHTIASFLPENQLTKIEVYQTILEEKHIPNCDYYIFTSPSNVQSFISDNELAKSSKIIAWGKSTQSELEKNQLQYDFCLTHSSLKEVVEILKNEIA